MKNNCLILTAILFTISFTSVAQYTTDKVVGEKNVAIIDSLKKVKYPYLLPAWGQKVINKGFSLPLPAGLSTQYIWQESDIIINDLQIGFNGGAKYSLDEIIRFEEASTLTSGINIRPDFWLFPFLNIYGIVAKAKSSTAIKAGLWLPDSTTWRQVMTFDTKAEFNSTTFGFGLTPTMGIGGFFVAIDMNFTWSDIEELEKPAFLFVLGPRIGKNFKFKDEKSLAVWVGGFRVHLESGTSGSLQTSDLFPTDTWGQKIDSGYIKVDNSQQQVNTWWNNLTPAEQKNPVNKAKYETANSALAKAGQLLDGASQIVTNAAQSTVQYSLNKTPKDKWNFIIGTQFQLNRRWMVRAEYGFLSSRQQFIGGLQYRFGF
jgi:hypothetical protein